MPPCRKSRIGLDVHVLERLGRLRPGTPARKLNRFIQQVIYVAVDCLARLVRENSTLFQLSGPLLDRIERPPVVNLGYIAIAPDGRQVRASVKGDRDPGYGSTSKMISECAICLLRDTPDVKPGIWTPGAAMSDRLIKRLTDHAGLTFAVES